MQFLHKILQFFKWSQTGVSFENPLNNLKFEEDGQFLTRQINRCTTFHGRSSEVQIALKHNERPLYNQPFMSENVNSFIFELFYSKANNRQSLSLRACVEPIFQVLVFGQSPPKLVMALFTK